MGERAYPATAEDWLDFSAKLWRAAYLTQRRRRGKWAKNLASAAESAASRAKELAIPPTTEQPND